MSGFIESKKRVPTKLDTPLAYSFGFDYGDIQDNRSGFISHWQKKRLRWYLLNYTFSVLVWFMLATFIPVGLLAYFELGNDVIALYIGAVFAVLGVIWLWQIRSVYLDLRHGKVAELVSTVSRIREARVRRTGRGFDQYERSTMDYLVRIGKERFITSKEQMEAFEEDELYYIYVAPESRQILSAELFRETSHSHRGLAFLSEDTAKDKDAILEDETYSTNYEGK